jgi:hypothetical protein
MVMSIPIYQYPLFNVYVSMRINLWYNLYAYAMKIMEMHATWDLLVNIHDLKMGMDILFMYDCDDSSMWIMWLLVANLCEAQENYWK